MRVVHIISSFGKTGGAEIATNDLVTQLTKLGIDITILTRKLSTNFINHTNAKIHSYGFNTGHFTKLTSLIYGLCSLAWLWRNKPLYDIIHMQNLDTPLLIGISAKIILNKPLVLTIHGEHNIYQNQKKYFGRKRIKLMLKYVDYYTAINNAIFSHLLSLGVSEKNVRHIPNSINTEKFNRISKERKKVLLEKLNLSDLHDKTIILFVGRLIYRKRVDLIINTYKKLNSRKYCLLIVGNGLELKKLKELASGSTVLFLGEKSNVEDYFKIADCFIIPSDYEGLPVALLEAMASGVTPIVSNCPGMTEIITDNENGFIFQRGNKDELFSILNKIIDNKELLSTIGRGARQTAENQFRVKIIAQKTFDYYYNILG